MLSLFDMLSNAQDGQGMDVLAKQFNLSQQQAQLAVEALLPAFSQGLKRNTADPAGLGSFLSSMASGQHAAFFDNADSAFSAHGVSQGNDVLGQLFGSKDLSRAVASQAAQTTGLSQQLLQQMLPVIASMVMGGLFKQSTNQMPAAKAAAGGNNPLAEIIEQMMKQGGLGGMLGGQSAPQQAPQQQAPQSQNPFDQMGNNPLGKVLQDMFGGGAVRQQTQNPAGADPGANPGANPWGKILEDMLGGGQQSGRQQSGGQQGGAPQGGGRQAGQRQAQQPEVPQPQAPQPETTSQNPYGDIFGKMFETGKQQQDDYQKGMESIFDQFKKGMGR
ncbi:MAG TPA: DUF937 domain-containing protein [Mesorhizobium sp.]